MLIIIIFFCIIVCFDGGVYTCVCNTLVYYMKVYRATWWLVRTGGAACYKETGGYNNSTIINAVAYK